MINLRRIASLLFFAGACAACAFAAPAKLLVKNATILTVKPGDEAPFVGYLAIGADGKIAAIGPGAPPADADLGAAETLDATGRIVIPGFISAHSHIWQSAFRGLAANQYVNGWSAIVYRQQAILATPEDFYWFTLHGCLDHLRHGITSVYNFTYGHRAGDFSGEQWRAELDSGIRFVHGYQRMRDVSEAEVRKTLEAFFAVAKPDLARPTFLRMSLSGGVQSVESVAFDGKLMRDYQLSNQSHYLELPLDKETQRARFAHLVSAGILGPDFYFGHFIHTDEPMLKAVAAAGSGMSWNPLSNGRLASGIADIPKYLSLGVKVGMGVDGQASADLPDPFENMRMGLYMIRAKYESALVLQPADVLRLHTLGSATVMGIAHKVGSLEVGKYGDFLVIDPAVVDRAPVQDPCATLVFACNSANLQAVYVGGDLVSEFGRLTRHDFPQVQKQLHARVTAITSKIPLAAR